GLRGCRRAREGRCHTHRPGERPRIRRGGGDFVGGSARGRVYPRAEQEGEGSSVLLSIEQIGHAHGGTGGDGGVCRQTGQQRVSAIGVIGANTVLTTAEQ